jgi:hypothetical protein
MKRGLSIPRVGCKPLAEKTPWKAGLAFHPAGGGAQYAVIQRTLTQP